MTLEYTGVKELVRTFGRAPADLRKELRPKLRATGAHIVTDMKDRASWSSRIPGAIRMTVSFAAKGGGVKFRVDSKRAPHARPYEGLGRAGTFRHPVFPDSDNRSDWNWAAQATRPFFFPAVKAGRGEMQKNMSAAVKAALREVAR